MLYHVIVYLDNQKTLNKERESVRVWWESGMVGWDDELLSGLSIGMVRGAPLQLGT